MPLVVLLVLFVAAALWDICTFITMIFTFLDYNAVVTCCNCLFSSPIRLLFLHRSCGEPHPISHGGFELAVDKLVSYYRLLLICSVISLIIVPLNVVNCTFTFNLLVFE